MNRRRKSLIVISASACVIALTAAIGWVVVTHLGHEAPAVMASVAEDLRGVTGVEKVDGLRQSDPDFGVTTVDVYLNVYASPRIQFATLERLASTIVGKVERYDTTSVLIHVTLIDRNLSVALSTAGGPKSAEARNRERLVLAEALTHREDVATVRVTWNLHSNHPNLDDSNQSLLVDVTSRANSEQTLLTTFSALAPLVSSTTQYGTLTVKQAPSAPRSTSSNFSKTELEDGAKSISFSLGGKPTDQTVLSFTKEIEAQSDVVGYAIMGGGDTYTCYIAITAGTDQSSIRGLVDAGVFRQFVVFD